MCPERQIISLYLDGELPSPWKEKMEAHLKLCPECRAVLAGYDRLLTTGKLDEKLLDVPEETMRTAMERVWAKLNEAAFVPKGLVPKGLVPNKTKKIWKRTITLPLPVAATAAVFIIVVFFAIIGIGRATRYSSQDPAIASGIGLDDQGMVPIQDMTGVFQYLSAQDNGDFMVIRLPESRRFSRSGEPALINAADYSRRNTFR